MLSAMLRSTPAGKSLLGGYTSISFAVKSVSGALEAAHSLTISLPVTSRPAVNGGVWKTSTSLRAESGLASEHSQKPVRQRWSAAPWNISVPWEETFPPSVGTGFRGSNRYVVGGPSAGLSGDRTPSGWR